MDWVSLLLILSTSDVCGKSVVCEGLQVVGGLSEHYILVLWWHVCINTSLDMYTLAKAGRDGIQTLETRREGHDGSGWKP